MPRRLGKANNNTRYSTILILNTRKPSHFTGEKKKKPLYSCSLTKIFCLHVDAKSCFYQTQRRIIRKVQRMNPLPMSQPHILLIITGSVAAYKSLELIRLMKDRGVRVTCVMTKGGQEFITPLSVASLSGSEVYTDLFSLKDETDMGHIRLSREANRILVAPASANILAKMAHGLADDLASTLLLATNKPVSVAPAMNPQMWHHPATQRNLDALRHDGIDILEPGNGLMACGEEGQGRMMEPLAICDSLLQTHLHPSRPLHGKHAIVTAGPTVEPLDPVRFLSNLSSGKQGYAIAAALESAGAHVTLISGPTNLPCPSGVERLQVQTSEEMLRACLGSLPADIFVGTAAVCDWRAKTTAEEKIKKQSGHIPQFELEASPDILQIIASLTDKRPKLVIGFAAETASQSDDLIALGQKKRRTKGCDWILANDVSGGAIFGEATTRLTLITENNAMPWPELSKADASNKIVTSITKQFIQGSKEATPA
jgi:phosphopantothenoylcysteine decarboxylase/phosphopantothenate--cysteine ligase